MAESVQHVFKQRALDGQYPISPQQIIQSHTMWPPTGTIIQRRLSGRANAGLAATMLPCAVIGSALPGQLLLALPAGSGNRSTTDTGTQS